MNNERTKNINTYNERNKVTKAKYSERQAKHIDNMIGYHNAYNLLCEIYKNLMNAEKFETAEHVKVTLQEIQRVLKKLGDVS